MLGLVLALFAGSSATLSNIFVRKGVVRSGESFSPLPISNFIGLGLFALVALISGTAGQLISLSRLGVISLAGAGIVHFIMGRQLAIISVRLIGANRALPIQAISIIFAVLLGVILLREPLTVAISLAALLIFGGAILIGTTGSYKVGKRDMPEGFLAKGVLAALGTAVCWGVSPALVKIGLNEIGFPLVGVLISYMASSAVIGLLLLYRPNSDKLRRLDRNSVRSFIIVAMLISTAQMLRYLAIDLSRISLVAPLIASIKPLLVIPLSFLMNRDIEVFGSRIIAGSVLVVAGIILVFVAA